MSTLRGRVAIVTGAGRGIGAAEAAGLAEEGAAVVVVDRDDSAYSVASEIAASGGEAVGVVADVTSMADAQLIVDTALDAFGGLDIVVNNAGILRDGLLHKMQEDDWDDVLRVNLRGHFTVTRAALPVLRERRWGRIINTASESGLGTSGSTNYAASKEGVIGFTRSLAREVAKFGITVNAIRPRAATPLAMSVADEMRRLTERMVAGDFDPGPPTFDVEARRKLTDRPDLMRPDVVAAFVVLLSSDEGGVLTGGDFIIGGDELAVLPPYLVPRSRLTCDGGWSLDALRSVLPHLAVASSGDAIPEAADYRTLGVYPLSRT